MLTTHHVFHGVFSWSDFRTSTIRPRFQRSTLVTNPRAHSIQSGGLGSPSSARQRSGILPTVHSVARRSESIITAICIIQSSSHPASCNVGARVFTAFGPVLWNSLPFDITSVDILSFFRRCLKYIYSVIRILALCNNITLLSWPRGFLYCIWSR